MKGSGTHRLRDLEVSFCSRLRLRFWLLTMSLSTQGGAGMSEATLLCRKIDDALSFCVCVLSRGFSERVVQSTDYATEIPDAKI